MVSNPDRCHGVLCLRCEEAVRLFHGQEIHDRKRIMAGKKPDVFSIVGMILALALVVVVMSLVI